MYSGITDTTLANASSPLPFLTRSPACPSPISVALDSTSVSERRPETSDGEGDRNSEAPAPAGGNAPKSRVASSLRRLLKRGCSPSAMFASLSPKCHAAAGTSSRIQPISPDEPSQAPSRRIGKYVPKSHEKWERRSFYLFQSRLKKHILCSESKQIVIKILKNIV